MTRIARIFVATALALGAGSGCRSAAEGAYVLCCWAPRYHLENPRRPPDTSTAHCDSLAGAEYTAENGDRLVFLAKEVRWTRDGATELRRWTCETDRRVVLAGFERPWQGTLHFLEEDGRLTFGQQPFRRDGSGHVFPCERVPGRTYFAETGDSIAFLDARTARWSTAGGGGTRTVSWRCEPMRITLRDGALEHAVVLRNSENLFFQELEWLYAPDGTRPPFPCDAVAGSRWRSPTGATLVFGATDAVWTTDAGEALPPQRWSCRGTRVWLEPTEVSRERTSLTLFGDRLHPTGMNALERMK